MPVLKSTFPARSGERSRGGESGYVQQDSAAAAGRRILIGPCSIPAVERVQWAGAVVKYLKKERLTAGARANQIPYDPASLRKAIAMRPVPAELASLVMRLSEDRNCLVLAERDRRGLLDGTLLAPIDIANCARYAWAILQDHSPDTLVFHNQPHELFTYVLLQVALYMRVPCLLVHYSVLPWRMSVSKFASDGSATKFRIKEDLNDFERKSIRDYMQRLRGSHDAAIPAVNAELVAANRRALHFGEELRALARGDVLKSVVRIAAKWSLYRTFRKFVTPETRGHYVIFLLHYQPEETTIPRGGLFSQQLNAIIKLRAMLPAHVSILVKENKAIFRLPLTLAIGVRSHAFYEAIASLPATYLVPLERDTFDLVDRSLAVATITGSVGIEALCRGKRVIVFGAAGYRDFAGVIRLDVADPAVFDLNGVVDGAPHDPAATEQDLLAELRYSIGPDVDNNETNLRAQQAAAIEAFEYVSQNLSRLLSHE